jgi:hypothetical protein
MKLIVCDTRDHALGLQLEHPDDKVVLVGDRLGGIKVTEIIDKTRFPNTERGERWWIHAECRVVA